MCKFILLFVVVAVFLFLADRLLLWCERRGWIYYRKRKAGGAHTAFLSMADFLEPGNSITVEQAEADRQVRQIAEEDEPRRPDEPGSQNR